MTWEWDGDLDLPGDGDGDVEPGHGLMHSKGVTSTTSFFVYCVLVLLCAISSQLLSSLLLRLPVDDGLADGVMSRLGRTSRTSRTNKTRVEAGPP